MTTPVKKMGYEALLYYGAAGSTASTQITNCRDVTYENDLTMGDTTIKGDGSVVPIATARPTGRSVSLSWTMVMKSNDTTLTALIAAARTGAAVALKCIPYSGGAGLDADCYIGMSNPQPLGGEQTVTFTLKGFEDVDRTPILNA